MSTSVAAEFAAANEGYVKNLLDEKKFLPLPPARKVHSFKIVPRSRIVY